LDLKCNDLHSSFNKVSADVTEAKQVFTDQATLIRNECLWRIKDTEELIRSRVQYVQLESGLKALKSSFEFDLKVVSEKHSE
jgi:hypothetical protein